ncbi:hypothetical protein F511_40765 [Dorcoceras hygrometricum]|uniref:Uncharacterized protein n=1 Tax=Dorcoceras hygrometricum TaxID=472368 RepID=A0A2Z6ZZQ1_9LAMI|nr:hypothetical protein F511_40765 [Dorcoceras hygrometricum]
MLSYQKAHAQTGFTKQFGPLAICLLSTGHQTRPQTESRLHLAAQPPTAQSCYTSSSLKDRSGLNGLAPLKQLIPLPIKSHPSNQLRMLYLSYDIQNCPQRSQLAAPKLRDSSQHAHKAQLQYVHQLRALRSAYDLQNRKRFKNSAYADQLRSCTLFFANMRYAFRSSYAPTQLSRHVLKLARNGQPSSLGLTQRDISSSPKIHPAYAYILNCYHPRPLHWTGLRYSRISSLTQHASTQQSVNLSACTQSDPARNYSTSFQAEFYKLYIKCTPSYNRNSTNSKQLALLRSAQATEPARTRAVLD